jgi:hypothetical protein
MKDLLVFSLLSYIIVGGKNKIFPACLPYDPQVKLSVGKGETNNILIYRARRPNT